MLLLILLLLPVLASSAALIRLAGTTGFVILAMLWGLGVPTVLSIAVRLGAPIPPLLDPRYELNRPALVIGLALVVGGALARAGRTIEAPPAD